jgi:predicted  nucleic acid-binding Zn-ribbon protein
MPSGQIRPKISSMPRQQSEDHACLEVYKLVVERKRLQRELDGIEQRKAQLQKRIAVLEQDITRWDREIQQSRKQTSPKAATRSASKPSRSPAVQPNDADYDTLMLEY